MTNQITVIAGKWLQYYPMLLLQSTLFLGLILILLYAFRERDPRLLKGIAVIGLLKLFVPAVISVPGLSGIIQQYFVTLPEMIIRPDQYIAADSFFTFPVIFFLCWLVPAMLFFSSFILHWKIFRYNLKGIRKLDKHSNLTNNYNLAIYVSSALHSPFLYGLFRPKLVVPKDWVNWDTLTRESVIEHELSHLRQADNWINILKIIAITLFYANPFVWLLIKKINLYSEIICDDASIYQNNMDIKEYNDRLINLAANTTNIISSSPILFFSNTHQLIKQRILYQFNKKENYIMRKFSLSNIIMLISISVLVIPFSLDYRSAIAAAPQGILADSTYNFYDVDAKPKLIHKSSPKYPDQARKEGIQGTVVISVTVDQKGDVEEMKVFKSVPELDAAALEAAGKTKFKPATHQGKPVRVEMNIPFKFKLK